MTRTAETAKHPAGFPVEDIPGGDRDLIGLARVSTDGQDAQLQRDDLRAAGCGRIYEEKASTRKATADRPGLTAALDYLRAGDTLVVWKLDRLGRSVKDVLTIADDLHERGVRVRILTGKLSGTYSPAGGQVLLHHDGRVRRTGARHHPRADHGRPLAARAQGRRGGRPVVMDADKLAAARARRECGESTAQIAKALGVSRASVYRHLGADSPDEAHSASRGSALARHSSPCPRKILPVIPRTVAVIECQQPGKPPRVLHTDRRLKLARHPAQMVGAQSVIACLPPMGIPLFLFRADTGRACRWVSPPFGIGVCLALRSGSGAGRLGDYGW